MNIILTGATGTLGSQILFSILESRFETLEKIFLIVRRKRLTCPETRIFNMLESDVVSDFIRENKADINSKIKVIPAEQLLEPSYFLLENTKYHKFIYISTAFSIGKLEGFLNDNYLNTDQNEYRNFYEASKHAAEKYLIKAGKEAKISIQILRPSVLGGNVLEAPNFFISKYMVFYLFAKFFHRNTSSDTIRIQANKDSILNIIPTDYAAKVITKVFDTTIEQLNIVNSTSTNIFNGITKILETVDFKNFSLTQELLETASDFESTLEKFYYETIGIHLTPYLTSKPYEWDTTLLESILPIPQYNLEEYLVNTIEYAKINGFKNQRW